MLNCSPKVLKIHKFLFMIYVAAFLIRIAKGYTVLYMRSATTIKMYIKMRI